MGVVKCLWVEPKCWGGVEGLEAWLRVRGVAK